MLGNFILLIAATLFAYASQLQTERCIAADKPYKKHEDPGYIALIVMFIAYAGFRTDYNDTYNYIRIFNNAPTIGDYFAQMESFDVLSNPLFYLLQSFVKTFVKEPRVWIFLTSVYIQFCFVGFIKRYSTKFTLSIFIYVCFGRKTIFARS